MEHARKNLLLGGATVLTAVGASLCCILPVAVVLLGVGSAAMASRLEPARPYLLALTALMLVAAHVREYRPRPCDADSGCAPASRRWQRTALELLSAIAMLLTAFPYYINWLI